MKKSDLEEQWDQLLFRLQLSASYHTERRRFFEFWDNMSSLIALLLSSGAGIAIFKDNDDLAIWLAFVVALLQGLDLIIGFGKKACLHTGLFARFVDLENLVTAEPTKSEAALQRCAVAKREIDKDEPPAKPYLLTRVQDDLCRRLGRDRPPLKRWQRLLAHYLPELGD